MRLFSVITCLTLAFAPCIVRATETTVATAVRDDAAWLREHGLLILEDAFDREETGNQADAIGNGWTSATANRVPDTKQADIDGGVLKVKTAAAAGHGAHIHHDALLEDGGAVVRFKLPGLSKAESLTVGFVDRQTSKSLAGHICSATVTRPPGKVTLLDRKTGYSDPDIARRRAPFLESRTKLPADLEAVLAPKMRDFTWTADSGWHELVVVTEGDEMRVSIDGRHVGSHRSDGFAHPAKRWFSLGIPTTAWIDDVKVYRVQ